MYSMTVIDLDEQMRRYGIDDAKFTLDNTGWRIMCSYPNLDRHTGGRRSYSTNAPTLNEVVELLFKHLVSQFG